MNGVATKHSQQNRQSVFFKFVQLFCVFFILTMPALARDSIEISSSNDFEAPNIEHDLNNDVLKDKAGDIVVRVRVTDEFSVNSVSLFFRDSDSNKYRKRPMLAAKGEKDIFEASIPAGSVTGSRIEYYFEADDKVGNKKLKGLEFSPLKMELARLGIQKETPKPAVSKTDSIAQTKPVEKAEEPATSEPAHDQPLTSTDFPMVWIPGL
ncbi:MAG: hypothetical protein OEZ43_06130 [Gammaproteobacteria bacterium]|nr:hypothetical protein [Gammaproteobacteria bacterium]